MKFRYAIILFVLAAFFQTLALPPFGLYPFAFIFAVPLFFFFEKERRLWVLLAGVFIYRLLAGLFIVYFVLDPIMFLLSAGIFLGLPLCFRLARRINLKVAFLLMPFLWTFWEYLEARYTILPNFIMTEGNALGSSPFLGLASWWGFISLIFFAIFVNILVFGVATHWKKRRRVAIYFAATAAVVLLGGYGASQYAIAQNKKNYDSRKNAANVVLVSESADLNGIFKKPLDHATLAHDVAGSLSILEKQLRDEHADLVVLPEGLLDVNYDMSTDPEALSKFGITSSGVLIGGYRKLAEDLSAGLVANITAFKGSKRYNALLFFDKEGAIEDVFYKKYLTLTGEYWPYGNWHPFYFDWLLQSDPGEYDDYPVFKPENNFSSGETKTARIGDLVIAPAACLEIHYPGEMEKRASLGGEVIINTTSNLWEPIGLGHYLDLTNNLRKIESVWLKIPVLASGRRQPPFIALPDGETVGPASGTGGDYEIFSFELRY